MEIDGCLLPEDRFYDAEVEVWLKPSTDGRTARIGLAGWLASFAGKFQSVTFRPVDGLLEAGRSVATVESIRYTGAVRLPVAGTVLERNDALAAQPKLVNNHPYDEGWIAVLALREPSEPERTLTGAAGAAAHLAEKIARLRVRCFPAVPDAELIEIGAECQAILVRLNEEIDRLAPEDVVLLVTDDPTAPIEMVRWEDRTGHRVIYHRREGALHQFLVRRERHPSPRARPGSGA
jgi:glycine cleavage system H protein